MIPPEFELEQLRLIDDFLEDGDDLLADDVSAAELEHAVAAAMKSKLPRIRAVYEREKDVSWKASFHNARLLFGKSDAL